MTILAIDYGTRRIGVARGTDGLEVSATTIAVKNKQDAIEQLTKMARESDAKALVFGLPLRLSGSEKEEAEVVRSVATILSKATGVPAVFVDERLTTDEAMRQLREQGVPEPELKHHVDAMVAELLLAQYYQNQKEHHA